MPLTSSRKINIALLAAAAGIYSAGYVYTKMSYVEDVSNDIKNLPTLHSEKITLEGITETEKTFTLMLSLSGVDSTTSRIEELKTHYNDIVVTYVCNSINFDDQFEEGFNINLDIKYSEEPEKTFNQTYISEKHCQVINS